MTALAARLRTLDVDQVAAGLRRLANLAAAAASAVETFREELANVQPTRRDSGTSTRRNARPFGRPPAP